VLAEDLQLRIRSLCSGVSERVVDEFFSRMDEDYFATFSPEDIATHIRMSTGLDSGHRVDVRVTRKTSGSEEFEIVIVGFDYLSEFSIVCGLLSAFGLDIRAGNIYSFVSALTPRAEQRKIVDVFTVALREGETFGEDRQREFKEKLQSLAQLLATGAADQAREQLNRFLTERVESMQAPLGGLVHPIEIRFDNDSSPEFTVMAARSPDSFALLYAISNALAMQGVDIRRVRIRSAGPEADDLFFIVDRWGRKILDTERQERLRMAVGMIKQFTRFLPDAPDPAKAMRHFDQFLDRMADEKFPDHMLTFLARAEGMELLAHLLGSSDYLWNEFLRVHFRELVPLLERLAEHVLQFPTKESLQSQLFTQLLQASAFEDKKRILNHFKDEQVFLIDVQHLQDPHATLMAFSRALTELAEVVIEEATRICAREMMPSSGGAFAVFGLGKFGGREMGYASDLELLFVHEERGIGSTHLFDSFAHRVVEFIEARHKGIFQIDLRLRPYGDAGAWSVPFDEFKRYYSASGSAAPFERQALIKLRWVGGDADLGRQVEHYRDSFTYDGGPWDRENALHLRKRQAHELVKPGATNVKYSIGGIIDIEYAVQYLQLLHGKDHAELRGPNTLEALEQLRRLRIVTEQEYEILYPAYLFLRSLIDALRIVRGDASDLLLPDTNSEEFKSLARRLGYRGADRSEAARLLATDVHHWMKAVHEVFEARFAAH